MKFIDMHCDTPSFLYNNDENSLRHSMGSVDVRKLKEGDALCQFFAFFLDLKKVNEPFSEFKNMFNNFKKEIDENKDEFNIILSYEDINKGKIGALFTVEEGGVIEGSIKNLRRLYDSGIRGMTLTWNYENSIGFPNSRKEFMNYGLKNFGIQVVEEMNKLGMIIDVSHLSDGGFYDVCRLSKKPVIASHSNSRAITDHPRNITDHMIKMLADKGGVMGLNFCSDFIGKGKITKLEDMILHLKHIRKIGGIDVIALGTDFDGIHNTVEIENISKMPMLEELLIKEGFSYYETEKVFYKNAERVLKDIL
ncbi:MAG: dipeptidase [Clostridiaceae bacterium]